MVPLEGGKTQENMGKMWKHDEKRILNGKHMMKTAGFIWFYGKRMGNSTDINWEMRR